MSDNKTKTTELDAATNFLESDGSLFRNSLLLDETRETLMAMESEGIPGLLHGGGQMDMPAKIFTPSQREEVDNCKFIVPEPGRCVKTYDKKSGEKVFINICKSHKVPEPPMDLTDAQLSDILGDGTDEEMDDVRIPMSVGEKRIEKDKHGNQCQAYDIIINSTFYQEKVLTSDLYCTFLIVISIEALDNKYKLELDRNNYVVLKNKQCHGKLNPQFVRSKAGIREVASNLQPTSVSTPFIRPGTLKSETPKPPPQPTTSTGLTPKTPAVKELKTTYFPKPDPYRKLIVNLWRYKDFPNEAEAEIHLPGLKDIKEVTVSYERDEIKLASPVGQCQLKCPININSDQSWPQYDSVKQILTLHLRLDPLSESTLKDWKKVGHNIGEYEKKLNMKLKE